ncbi:class I SAM-dependent methyltransferase [Sporolactobacillus shoreicorticis]|uniref:Class I SAM-dependent methyltransferase n=1 Tax=Sporolactobacillus shoreicorticis TaxID=1923877 RepID=A0ABW5S9Q0_9BACL|nr:class I SAM-dependent methyltransferase [Sporolactobacillus shoreicorticis]MCO7125743.1 class I SAM-dependent methyltransferase [Sporolactobacillus shoreicorticis]
MSTQQQKEQNWRSALLEAWRFIEAEGISATIEGTAALKIQGCAIHDDSIHISIQWDALEQFYQTVRKRTACELKRDNDSCFFTFQLNEYSIRISGYFGTVIRTDPDRLLLSVESCQVAVKSFGYFLHTLPQSDSLREIVKDYLRRLQNTDAGQNGHAWNNEAYQAWINRFGKPEQAAAKIKENPAAKLGALAPYLKEIQGEKIINLLGSHGSKALALALMGAQVTVVDISSENAAYAKNVADALHVTLNYVISDVLQLPVDQHKEKYDKVFMELGILHYFIDLEPLAELVFSILKPGGQFLIQEFHPVSTKLVTTRGKRQIVFGNYFDQSLHARQVAFSKHLSHGEKRNGEKARTVFLREWTLGEIVTAFAQAGLIVQRLDETPNMKINDIGLPKLFTLICLKP